MAVEVQNLPVAGDTNMNSQLRDRQNASSLDDTSVPGHINEDSYLLEGSDNERSDYEAFGNDPADGVDTGKGWRRPSIFWVLPVLFLYMLSFGGTIVPRINLMLNLICRDFLAEKAAKDPTFTPAPVIFDGENPQCQVAEVQARMARFELYLSLTAGTVSALVSPQMGRLSDRYGRTKIIAWAAIASTFGEAMTVLVASVPDRMPLGLMLLGALFDGLGGSYTIVLALVTSYVSDCTLPERRVVAFGFTHGFLFTGIAAGPGLSALLIKATGRPLDVFVIGLVLYIIVLAMVLLVVPESLSEEHQLIAREKHRTREIIPDGTTWTSRLNPLNLIKPLSILMPPAGRPSALFPNRQGASPALRRNIMLLSAMDTIVFGVGMGTSQILIIYAEYMFGWGNVESSVFVFEVNVVRMITLFVLLPIVSRIFREPPSEKRAITGSSTLDVYLIRLSILLNLLGYIGYSLSKHGSVFTFSGIITALGGMGSVTLQSSLTKHVTRERTGQILGALGLLHAICRITAPTILSLLYSATVGKATQAAFITLAAVFGGALLCSCFVRPHVSLDDVSPSNSHAEGNYRDDTGYGDDAADALLQT